MFFLQDGFKIFLTVTETSDSLFLDIDTDLLVYLSITYNTQITVNNWYRKNIYIYIYFSPSKADHNSELTNPIPLYPPLGNSNPIQYSCLENLMDWGAW